MSTAIRDFSPKTDGSQEPVIVAEAPIETVMSSEVAAPRAAERWAGAQTRTICLVVVAVVAGGAALYFLRYTLTPLLIALFVYYLMKPLTEALSRSRVPRVLFAPALAVGLLAGLFFLGQAIYASATAMSEQMPVYRDKLVDRLDATLLWLGTRPGEDGRAFNHDHLDRYIDQLWESHAGRLAEGVMGTIEVALMAVFYLLFLFIEAQNLPRRIYEAFRADTAADAQNVGAEVNDRVKQYLFNKTVVNLGLAASTGAICWLMGLHFWFLWAVVMFLLNYITYIGSIVALVPPVLLALIQFESPWVGVGLAVALTVNRLVWVDYVEIRYLGTVLNLSPLVMLLSIAFFGALWGPVGLLLAVPLMTSLKIVLANADSTRHFAVLISEE